MRGRGDIARAEGEGDKAVRGVSDEDVDAGGLGEVGVVQVGVVQVALSAGICRCSAQSRTRSGYGTNR